jgi:hypothetical protein
MSEKENKLAADILRRFERLKTTRSRFEGMWKESEEFVSATLIRWEDEKPDDPYNIPKRISNKPTNFLNTCVTGIAGYAMSPNIKWFKLSLQNKEMAEADGVAQWLEQCERIMCRVFERCGFYNKALRWLELAGVYGQSAMLIEELSEEHDAPLRYHTVEPQELYLADNEVGETEVVYRAYWTDVENVVNHYGRKAMHENIAKRYDDYINKDNNSGGYGAGADMYIKLLHAVFKRRSGEPDKKETRQNKKWASVIIDIANKHIIAESGYDEFPYAVFFWEKSGKPYGISPTMKAVNDIKLYHAAMTDLLTVAEYSANPAKNVPDIMRGNENFQPGGFNYFVDPAHVASQLEVGTNFPITIQITQMLEQNIKEWYNVDFFLMLRANQTPINMTATEVAARLPKGHPQAST